MPGVKLRVEKKNSAGKRASYNWSGEPQLNNPSVHMFIFFEGALLSNEERFFGKLAPFANESEMLALFFYVSQKSYARDARNECY